MPGEGLAPDAAVPGVGDGTGLSPVVGGASVWPKFGSPGGDSSTPCTLFDGLDLVTGLLAPGLAPGVVGAGVLAAGLVGAAGKPVVAAGSGVIVLAGGSGASVAACEVGAGVPGAAEAALLSWGGRGAAVVAWGKAADPTVMAGAAAVDMRELSFSPKLSMKARKALPGTGAGEVISGTAQLPSGAVQHASLSPGVAPAAVQDGVKKLQVSRGVQQHPAPQPPLSGPKRPQQEQAYVKVVELAGLTGLATCHTCARKQ